MNLVGQPRRQAVQLLKNVPQVGTLIIRRNLGEEIREEGREEVKVQVKEEVKEEVRTSVSQ